MNRLKLYLVAAAALGLASAANAGNIYMTGHDVLLHGGQNNYDNLILDYLRNGDKPAASYNIGLLRGFSGGVGSVGSNTLEGFGTVTTRDIADWSALDAAAKADFAAFVAGVDVIVIPSHTACGGCDLTSTDADILEGLSAEITAFFNADGDIYANSGSSDTTFYNFLPPGVATSGLPIGGFAGFTCTAAGNAIGITGTGCSNAGANMINGFPTHSRFVDFDADFTVFEVRGTEVISIGLRGGTIGTDDISADDGSTDGSTDGGDDTVAVAEPASLALLGAGLLALGAFRRRRA
jgi:hypothetical protein